MKMLSQTMNPPPLPSTQKIDVVLLSSVSHLVFRGFLIAHLRVSLREENNRGDGHFAVVAADRDVVSEDT